MRVPLLPAALLALLLTCCGDPAAPSAPTPSPSPSAPSAPPSTALQESPPAGAADLVLREVTVEDGDRVVLTFAGTGRPGWAVRYVDEAVLDGSGKVVDLAGDAVLRLDVTGTPTTPDAPDARVGAPAGVVADLDAVPAWEGVTQVFAGVRGEPAPFTVEALADPSRLVVDLG